MLRFLNFFPLKEACMSADRYLKLVLTVIAIELGWLAIQGSGVPLEAQRAAPMQVIIKGVDLTPKETLPVSVINTNGSLPVTLTGNNAVVPIMSGRPLQIEQPLIVQADRALPVENGQRPLVVQVQQAAPSARPGPFQ
jgi:hypothetical protein